MASLRTLHRHANKVFAQHRIGLFCNWCGDPIVNQLVHHGDGNPAHNVPTNLWALCGRRCHIEVHDAMLDGREIRGAAGGRAANGAGLRRFHSEGKGTAAYSERQTAAARAGTGESKAKGARVANAISISCPDCDRTMNPGALGMHSRVHRKAG